MFLVEVPANSVSGTGQSEYDSTQAFQANHRRSSGRGGRRSIFSSRVTSTTAPSDTHSAVVKRPRRRLNFPRLKLTLPLVALFNLLRDVVSLTNWWTQSLLESARLVIVNINVNAQSAIVNVANVTHNVHVVLATSSADQECLDEFCLDDSHGDADLHCGVSHEMSEFDYQATFSRVTVDQSEAQGESRTKFKLSNTARCGVASGHAFDALMAHLAVATNALSAYFHSVASANVKSICVAVLILYLFHRAFTYMLLYPLFRLLFGTLYPAYASYKAVKSKNVKEYVKWMMYWIVFALFTCAETITDVFLSWFPFYYEIKIILVIWLLSPATKGSSFLYRKFVHPMLSSREQEIDEYISKAKEQSYKQVLDIGQKGVNALMQTALKGGGGLVNQIRKSYSLSDLTDPRHARHDDDVISDIDGVPLRKRSPSKKQRPGGISTSMYFSEIDVRTEGIASIASAEDISSGYSSNETLLQLAGQSPPKLQREVLSRGASLKTRPTRVTRAGAATAVVGTAKKSVTTDDGSEEDVIFVNGKPERLSTIPSISPSPHSSQSSSDNEFMDTFNDSDDDSTIREVPVLLKMTKSIQGNFDVEESTVQSEPDTTNNTNNTNLKDTQELQEVERLVPKLPEQARDLTKEDQTLATVTEDPKETSGISGSLQTSKEAEEEETGHRETMPETTKDNLNTSEDLPTKRRGKYHKKTAPTPPKQKSDRTILDESQVGAITATLVLQPGIIKPLSEGDEVFCHSPKLRRRTKSRSRSKSPSLSPSPKLYRKLFNKSPSLGKKDVKDASGTSSPMAKFMGLFKHEDKEKDKRSSWHESTSSVGEKEDNL